MKCESALTNILGTPIDTNSTYDLTMQVGDGIYDLYTLGGLWDPDGGRTVVTGDTDDDVDDPWTTAGTTAPVIDITPPGPISEEEMKKRLCEEDVECKEFVF
jgi:hypothetical protein